MAITFVENEKNAIIKVIGVGGAGGNAINNMIDANLQGVTFISANTDRQALGISNATVKLQLGEKMLNGLGAGADSQKGKEAALESEDAIRGMLEGSNMVFIAAGFGGGTGTGAAPVIAQICKDQNILTVAVVSKPFSFEGKPRLRVAEEGIEALREVADTVIIIPNDRLRGLASKNTKMIDMYKKADEILLNSVKGITDLIYVPGYVNLDFQDIRKIMSKSGMALMGIGVASGENRAIEAAEKAISHPLLEDMSISGASGVLMNITSSMDITMDEMTEASERIYREIGNNPTTEIIWGQIFDNDLGDEMRVTVIATGIGQAVQKPQLVKKVASFGDYRSSGKVRDLKPEDFCDFNNLDEPTFIRKVKVAQDNSSDEIPIIQPGTYDDDDLEMPTFLRRRVD
ncbi:MAG TPA: cell division protein FtsZ [Desulfatirhabdiaceae bacterium]|nr:cell division protein FtsZ [Desulfatirhabdiaceae bacterium]